MASAAEERTGAANAAFLPALIAGAPQPPSPVERLGSQPEDADERFAFALWSAGRKDEAVEFLEQQIARRKGGEAAKPVIIDVSASPRPAATLDIPASERPPVPPPPVPLRPFVVGAAALALAVFLFWPLLKGIATFQGWPDETETAFVAESGPAALDNGPVADTDVAVVVRDVTPPSIQGPIQGPPLAANSGENVAEIPTPLIPAPLIEEPAAADAAEPGAQVAEDTANLLPLEEDVALVSPQAPSVPEQPANTSPANTSMADASTAGLDEALVGGGAASQAPVTLATLADEVWDGARLPRPRPEPAAELVAALNASPVSPRPVYTYGATQQPPAIVPPPYPSSPGAVNTEPRRLTIIGRVGGGGRVGQNVQIRRYGAPWAPVRQNPSVNVYRYQPPPWPGASPGGY